MDNAIRETWLNKWEAKVGTQETTEFKEFLQACPEEIKDNLAREPLLPDFSQAKKIIHKE